MYYATLFALLCICANISATINEYALAEQTFDAIEVNRFNLTEETIKEISDALVKEAQNKKLNINVALKHLRSNIHAKMEFYKRLIANKEDKYYFLLKTFGLLSAGAIAAGLIYLVHEKLYKTELNNCEILKDQLYHKDCWGINSFDHYQTIFYPIYPISIKTGNEIENLHGRLVNSYAVANNLYKLEWLTGIAGLSSFIVGLDKLQDYWYAHYWYEKYSSIDSKIELIMDEKKSNV